MITPEELAWRRREPALPAPGGPAAGVRSRAKRPRAGWVWTALVALGVAWSLSGSGLRLSTLIEGREGALRLLQGLLRPDLSVTFLGEVAILIGETVQVSVAGLLLAVAIAAPLAVALAGNVQAPVLLRSLARVLAAALRGVPELLWALLFVAAVGPGPAAGTLALAVHAGGMLAKLYAEQLEGVDPAPVEAVRLAGAPRLATLALAILPQARNGVTSLLLYQWECNIRCSVVLGFVGAGGIGQALTISLKLFEYRQLSTLVLAVLALILAVDGVSRLVRRRLGANA